MDSQSFPDIGLDTEGPTVIRPFRGDGWQAPRLCSSLDLLWNDPNNDPGDRTMKAEA